MSLNKLWAGGAAILLFCLAAITTPITAHAASARLVVAGQARSAVPVEWRSGEAFVALKELLEPLRIKLTDARQEKAVSFLLPGGRKATVRAGDDYMAIDGKNFSLGMKTEAIHGDISVPLRPFARAVGLIARWDEERENIVVSPRIDDLQVVQEAGSVKFILCGTFPLHAAVQNLVRPRRIFLDIPNAVMTGASREISINRKPIIKARLSQNRLDPDVVRLVINLNGPADYSVANDGSRLIFQVNCAPSGKVPPGSLITSSASSLPAAEAPARVEDIDFEILSDKIVRVKVNTSRPVRYAARVLPRPDRLVVDLYGASRSPELAGLLQVGQTPLKQIRVSQFQLKPPMVRVVLDLSGSAGYRSYEDPENPNGIIIEVGNTHLTGKTIVLDPGHGGSDPGAIGPSSLRESQVVLDVASRLRDLLQANGVRALMTRCDDTFISLDGRVDFAAANNADLFVSVHANAIPARQVTGIETYYTTPQSLELAQVVHRALTGALPSPDRGVRQARFLVIRKSRMPAVLLEIGFISSGEEEALLASPQYRQRAAQAIYDGLEGYLLSSQPLAVERTAE